MQFVRSLQDWVEALLTNPMLGLGVAAVLLVIIWLVKEPLWRAICAIAKPAVGFGCGLLLAAALIVTVEVIIRKAIPDTLNAVAIIGRLFGADFGVQAARTGEWVRQNWAFSGSDEISGYLFAIGTSWSLAHVLITRGHVRIDVLYNGFSPRVRAVLDIVSLIFLAVFVGALLERSFNVAATNLIELNRSNTNLRIPLAWSQVPWFAGILLFFVTIIVAILRSVDAFLRGDLATVNATAGVSSQDDEIEGELKGLGIERPHTEKA